MIYNAFARTALLDRSAECIVHHFFDMVQRCPVTQQFVILAIGIFVCNTKVECDKAPPWLEYS